MERAPRTQGLHVDPREFGQEAILIQHPEKALWQEGKRMRVLVADDDAVARRLLQRTLEQAGYQVLAVGNGRDAVERLTVTDGPRLALLDWIMPEFDGPAVCREVRRRREQPYVHMILVTSKNSKEDIVSGLEAGADDYLSKPFNTQELEARLRRGCRIIQLEDKLVHNAFHDSLTQLPNRTLFLDRLANCVARAKRRKDWKFAILFVDLDRFKIVNDSLGHLAGDQLLLETAQRLRRSIRRDDLLSRPGDIPEASRPNGGTDTLARLGGDEFTVLLEDIRNESDGIRVAERIQQQLTAPFVLSGQEVFATASIGIALSTTGYDAAEDMLRDADTAMYRAKALGKSRCEMFDPAMHATAVSRLKLETDLHRAIERREFRVYYQPIVRLRDQRIVGFEALLRWQRPDFGLVEPASFLPLAEETGLITQIGKWALREACQQIRLWQVQFRSHPILDLAVNVSAKQFLQADLPEYVAQTLRETDLDPSTLKLELTESVAMQNAERSNAILRELKALGISLSIDDFGTGYSSLSYLRRFPVDALKIDRSFVSEMENNNESREIVHMIMTLARNLHIEVIAEGTETAEQVRQIEALGCDYAQGYYFSRPVGPEAIVERLLTSETNAVMGVRAHISRTPGAQENEGAVGRM